MSHWYWPTTPLSSLQIYYGHFVQWDCKNCTYKVYCCPITLPPLPPPLVPSYPDFYFLIFYLYLTLFFLPSPPSLSLSIFFFFCSLFVTMASLSKPGREVEIFEKLSLKWRSQTQTPCWRYSQPVSRPVNLVRFLCRRIQIFIKPKIKSPSCPAAGGDAYHLLSMFPSL